MTWLKKYKLLAFICAFKRYRRNSVLYKSEKDYAIAKKLGINVKTVHEYLYCARHYNYLTKRKDGTEQFIPLDKIIMQLICNGNSTEFHRFKFVRFFKESKSNTFKQFYEEIRVNIVLVNYKRQKFIQDFLSDAKELLTISQAHRKATLGKAGRLFREKFTVRSLKSKSESSNGYIVSGKNHVSNLLGCSTAQASKLLQQWHEVFFKRESILYFFNKEEKWKIAYVRASNCKYIQPHKEGFVAFLGSKIELFEKEFNCSLPSNNGYKGY